MAQRLCSRIPSALRGLQGLERNKHPSLVYNRHHSYSTSTDERLTAPRESDQFDVVIVGAGPAGLSAAIRLKQLSNSEGKEFRVCVVEKGAEVGSHILSGAVIEPRALNELIPDWKERGAPLNTPATDDRFYLLPTAKHSIRLPTPPQMNNHGNYIVSLGEVCRWLGKEAEALGVEIYPGFAASEMVYNADGSVKGIATKDVGINKKGEPKSTFTRGMELHARATLLAEGCRGSLTKTILKKYNLYGEDPQTYGLGVKEMWQVPEAQHHAGRIIHTIGWPVGWTQYGGSFIYHMKPDLVAIGFVVGLNYENPYLSPYKELQRFKHHPLVSKQLSGGTCVGYGARAINEGGLQAVPNVVFPGGALIGCSAGFVNVPKIKGSHNAMKSGMLAAESAFEALATSKTDGPVELRSYPDKLRNSFVWEDLRKVRNIRPALERGLLPGLAYSALDTYVFRGNAPWTFHISQPDHTHLKPAAKCEKIDYPKPDGVLSFDLMTNLTRSGTNHEEDQPPHLKVADLEKAREVNYNVYDGPEGRYCPAGVYEWNETEKGPKLTINAQNCLHCKTCDIKDPTQNINYTTPEGGGGPAYPNM